MRSTVTGHEETIERPLKSSRSTAIAGHSDATVPVVGLDGYSFSRLKTPQQDHSMDRRTFVGSIAGSLVVPPLAVRAQKPATPVIGFLNSATPELYEFNVPAFRKGLEGLGYIESRM